MDATGSWVVTTMIWSAGLCSWAATLMSAASIWSHCKNYSQPNLQRWVIRIIMMVPVYALTAWYSLVSVSAGYYLDTVRDIYEAFVIYCFVSLLIAYFGGERAFLVAMHDQNPTKLFWPASLVRKDLDLSDPYDYLFLKRGILQYVLVKPILAVSTMVLRSLGAYHEGEWGPSDGYLWTQVVYNSSVSLSLYCLVVFYMATRSSLAQWKPLPKFMCVKAIVFFSYWQGLGLSILVGLGVIHDTTTVSAEHVATFLQSWLICLEMIGGALGHWVSFSYEDYVPSTRLAGRVRLFYAVRDALGIKDVVVDAKSAWSGHTYTYRHFGPTGPVDWADRQMPQPARGALAADAETETRSLVSLGESGHESEDTAGEPVSASGSHSSPIKERRLRAGMRYTQGGKKTYWLPVDPVDHRAVAFAGGSSAGRTRAKLLYGVHGAGSGARAAVEFIGSTVHAPSRAVHESRRVYASAQADERSRLVALGGDDAGYGLASVAGAGAVAVSVGGLEYSSQLAELSMELGASEVARDDALYDEARGVEGDFNYPVMEIGVAFGYARRRPYGGA